MRVVLDECVRRSWLAYLASAGHEALDWVVVAGHGGEPDDVLLAWAAAHDAVVLTADSDLGQIVWARRATAPTVVQLEQPEWRPAEFGMSVLTALAECRDTPAARFFVGIRADHKYRLRRLPML